MRAASARALLLALLVLPAAFEGAGAQAPSAQWEYRITVPDPASGRIHVEVILRNLHATVTEMTFFTLDHDAPIVLDPSYPSTPRGTKPGGFGFAIDGPEERFAFEVDVRRSAFREGEYLEWAGESFALFKAETFALPFAYSYYGVPPPMRARIVFDLPEGWRAAGPWAPAGDSAFLLPPGDVLPRGYVALGPFDEPAPVAAGGKTVRHVRLGGADVDEALARDLVNYVDRATPFLASAYGPAPGAELLVVTAPAPMFRGGLGAAGSVFLHEAADLATFAHEYAHVHQQFAVVETGGRASVWFAEGDAELHGALSLLVAGFRTSADVQAALDAAANDRENPALASASLVNATYGTSLERFAYRKGLHAVVALDALLAQSSDGRVGLPDVLRELNRRHAHHAEAVPTRVTNEELESIASGLAGVDLSAFFDRHVRGPEWPEAPAFVPKGRLTVIDFGPHDARGAPGEPIELEAKIVNSGTARIEGELRLLLDGEQAAAETVRLEVAGAAERTFTLVLAKPGVHQAGLGSKTVTVTGLRPADLRLERTGLAESTIRAGEAATLLVYMRNDGDRDGAAGVDVIIDGARIGGSPQTIIEAGTTEVIAVALRFDSVGERQAAVRASQGHRLLDERIVTFQVMPADRDRDGTPDDADAYPGNPNLAEQSALNDVRDKVPAPLWLTLAALVLAPCFRARRSGG